MPITCAQCDTVNPDDVERCQNCNAELVDTLRIDQGEQLKTLFNAMTQSRSQQVRDLAEESWDRSQQRDEDQPPT